MNIATPADLIEVARPLDGLAGRRGECRSAVMMRICAIHRPELSLVHGLVAGAMSIERCAMRSPEKLSGS